MADSRIPFSRFNPTVPTNLAIHGSTAEEIFGSVAPDGDVNASPMATRGPSDALLALKRGGSDAIRAAMHTAPGANPYWGAQPSITLTRSFLIKLDGRVIDMLGEIIKRMRLERESIGQRMLDSSARLRVLRAYLGGPYFEMLQEVHIARANATKS